MKRLGLAMAAGFLSATVGCVAVVESDGHSSSSGHSRKVVVVSAGHICLDSCDHFFLDGVWYVEVGHRHSSSCGHYLVNGKWGRVKGDGPPGHSGHPHGAPPGQAKKVVVVESSHACVDSCEHFFLDGVWYIEAGHRHGSSCGHYLVKGKWGKDKGDDHKDKDKDKGKDKGKDKKDKKDKD